MPMAQKINEGTYLTFALAQEEYGIEMHRVLEIQGTSAIEPLADGSPLVRGILSGRGKRLPVLDLRGCLGKAQGDLPRQNCIVTVAVRGWEGKLFHLALLVDGVREVVQVLNQDLEEAPEMEEDARAEFLKGLAQCQERLVILLDLDRLARLEELEEVKFEQGGSHEIA